SCCAQLDAANTVNAITAIAYSAKILFMLSRLLEREINCQRRTNQTTLDSAPPVCRESNRERLTAQTFTESLKGSARHHIKINRKATANQGGNKSDHNIRKALKDRLAIATGSQIRPIPNWRRSRRQPARLRHHAPHGKRDLGAAERSQRIDSSSAPRR